MCAGETGSLSEIDPIGTANQEGLEEWLMTEPQKHKLVASGAVIAVAGFVLYLAVFGMRAFDLKGLVLMVAFFSAVAKVSTVKRARNPMF